jgi:hypothetical protein
VRSRRADGTGPATVINDLVWIGAVLPAAKNVKELPVRPEITQEASSASRELRLISKPRRRARRPTSDELARLTAGHIAHDGVRLRAFSPASGSARADPDSQSTPGGVRHSLLGFTSSRAM